MTIKSMPPASRIRGEAGTGPPADDGAGRSAIMAQEFVDQGRSWRANSRHAGILPVI